jgi:hypothetical protein
VKNTKRVIAALVSFLLMIGLAGCGLVTRTPEGEKKVVGFNIDEIQKLIKL